MDSRLHQAALTLLLLCPLPLCGQTYDEWRDSLAVINRQIARSPHSIDLRLRKAAVNIELQQWDYAVEEYSGILKHDPKCLAALFFRAYAYGELRRYDLARADYERFLIIVPRHFEAQLALALTCEKMGRKTETYDRLNQLVDLFPDSASAYAARASFERDQQMLAPAEEDWRQAHALNPTSADYHLSLIDILLQNGKREEARRQLDLLSQKVGRAALREWYEK